MTTPPANHQPDLHEQIEGMLPFFVAGTLKQPEADFVRQHLSTCPRCRQSLAEWFEIAHAVQTEAQAWGVPLPPLAARVRVHAGLSQTPTAVHQRIPLELPTGDTVTARPASGSRRPNAAAIPSNAPQRRRLPLTLVAAMITLVLAAGLFAALRRGDQANAPTLTPSVLPATFTALPPSETPSPATPTLSIPTLDNATSTEVPIIPPTARLITITPRPITSIPQQPPPTATNEYDIPAGTCAVTNATGLDIYVYMQPYDGAPVAGTLTPNQQVVAWVQSGTGWYQISSIGAGLIGWVKGDQVAFRGECANLPMPTPTYTPTLVDDACIAVPNTPDLLSMYYGPGTNYDLAANVPNGARLLVQSRSENGWWQVQYSMNGILIAGWVDGALVTVQGTSCGVMSINRSFSIPTVAP